MKTYLTFESDGEFAKRPLFAVSDRSGSPIAQVFWHSPWRQYTARFNEDSVWSAGCMDELAAFLRRIEAVPLPLGV